MTVILNFLSGQSYTLISLVSVSGALFCPFDWTLFPPFCVPFSFVLISAPLKKQPCHLVFYVLALTGKDLHQSSQLKILATCVCRFLIRVICWFLFSEPHNLLLALVSVCCIAGSLKQLYIIKVVFFVFSCTRYLLYARSNLHSELVKTETSLQDSPLKNQNIGCRVHSFLSLQKQKSQVVNLLIKLSMLPTAHCFSTYHHSQHLPGIQTMLVLSELQMRGDRNQSLGQHSESCILNTCFLHFSPSLSEGKPQDACLLPITQSHARFPMLIAACKHLNCSGPSAF